MNVINGSQDNQNISKNLFLIPKVPRGQKMTFDGKGNNFVIRGCDMILWEFYEKLPQKLKNA
jgi:hypothetical protein